MCSSDLTKGAKRGFTKTSRRIDQSPWDRIEGSPARLERRRKGQDGNGKHDLTGRPVDPWQPSRDKPDNRQREYRSRQGVADLRRTDGKRRDAPPATCERKGETTTGRKRGRRGTDLDGMQQVLALRPPEVRECRRAERERQDGERQNRNCDAKARHYPHVDNREGSEIGRAHV